MKTSILGLLGALAFTIAGATVTQAQQPKRGGTLQFAISAETPHYDCHGSDTYATLHFSAPFYNTLLRFNLAKFPDVEGDLAQSWTVAPDLMTYTFKLHQGVKFHDGTPLTSADVKATYDRLRNPPSGVVSTRQATFADIGTIETPDASTVIFKMKAVNASMLEHFASPWNCIYAAKDLAADPNAPKTKINGTGPYIFVEHVKGGHVAGKRNDNYFKPGLPYLDGFKGVFTLQAAAMLNAIQGGQLLAEYRGISPAERDRLVSAMGDKIRIEESSWTLNLLVSFNTEKKPFDDVRVRQALSLALDRWAGGAALSKISIMKHVGGIMRPGSEWALPEADLEQQLGYARDIEKSRAKARELLQQAGVENLTVKLFNRTVSEPYTPAGIFVINEWRKIGVAAEHLQVETRTYFDSLVAGSFEVAIWPLTEPADDPSAQLYGFITNKASTLSYSRHNDAKLDDLFERQQRTLDPVQRLRLVQEADRYALAQAYSVPFLWWNRIVVHDKKIKGWTMSPSHFQGTDLTNVWLEP